MDIKKIYIIASYTLKEILKSKILVNILFLGAALLLVTFIAYNFTYGAAGRVALDFGLGTLSISSVAISIFIGSGLLSKEIESRTVYMIISRPVSRASFILGKIIGLSAVVVINISILSALTLLIYFLSGGEFQSLILWAIFFTMLEAILVLLVVNLLSLVTSQTLAVIITIVVYIIGHAINETILTTTVQANPLLSSFIELTKFILPSFYKLNLKDFVLYKQSLPISYLMGSVAYAFTYAMALISLSIFTFNKKNLD